MTTAIAIAIEDAGREWDGFTEINCEEWQESVPCVEGHRHEWLSGYTKHPSAWGAVRGLQPQAIEEEGWQSGRTKTFICRHCRKAVSVTPKPFTPSAGSIAPTVAEKRALCARPIPFRAHPGFLATLAGVALPQTRQCEQMAKRIKSVDTLKQLGFIL